MTAILGIVNLTPDSFSDGGQFVDPYRAISHVKGLLAEGATAIDLGPCSSHPGAPLVAPAVEIERLKPVLEALIPEGVPISVDSFHPETQRYALSKGVAYLNDIHGFPHPNFYPELAAADCHLIVMHTVHGVQPTTRVVTDPTAIVQRIKDFFNRRLEALTNAGIAQERLILDPGMGFFLSAEPEASLEVLQNLAQLRRKFNLPMLVGVSRKSFVQRLTGQAPTETGAASLIAELFVANQGIDWIRTHNVRALRDGLLMQNHLNNPILVNRLATA